MSNGRRVRGIRLLILLFWGLVFAGYGSAGPGAAAAAEAETEAASGAVYVIPVNMTVQSGLASFLDRALSEAEEAGASLVVLDVDTPGGRLDAAEEIGGRIRGAKVPTVAFVSGKAASAGAYLALNAGGIAMSPGSTIGAAMIVDGSGNAVDNPKLVAHWTSEMVAAAELNGRNPEIAAAMVDPSRTVEMKTIGRTKERGQILSLSAEEAFKVGYADTMAKSTDEVIAWKGLADRGVVELQPSFAERVSQWLTSPGVSTLLLIIGIAGIAIELIVPGFGVPGIVGLLGFGLYFFGQSVAGFAELSSMVVFIAGIVLLVLEMFVPSFGILGILGVSALIYGIASAAYDTGHALRSLGMAAAVAVVIVAVFAYVFRRRGIWNRFILRDQLTKEQGYVPNESREELVGLEGVAKSALRPAGVAEIGGRRVDVVTSGDFIAAGSPVRVTAVDGTRVLVEKVEQPL
ncbi:NfeD family protein [Cohnella caldifontis]|uniref:NfeD family protein n=1 Tax=Cohnella caldifontis TaxID=3027471 RepID=UPI0023ED7877|nr:nodulation protein NfeD [Cohnella sp. YIM B05605]